MRKSFTVIMLGVLAAAATPAAQADNLFSNVSIGSPFGSDETQGAVPPRQTPEKLAGPASLSEMLRNAGLTPRELDTRIVSVKVRSGESTLPVLMTFTEDHNRLRMVMILGVHKNGIPSETLMGLMDANRENAAAFFAYSKKQRRTELHRIVENRSMTPDRLKAELGGMARIASQTRELWAVKSESASDSPAEGNSGAGNVATERQTAPSSQPEANSTSLLSSLVGQWAASRSKKEAFALRISANGKFALVTVVNGKTSQSTGQFTLKGSQLTLKDKDGTTISGTVTLSSKEEFKFLSQGAKTPLTFKKAS